MNEDLLAILIAIPLCIAALKSESDKESDK